MTDLLGLDRPAFLRPADQRERDAASNAQRRLEATLHARWLALAVASGDDWWDQLVPPRVRRSSERFANKDGGSLEPESLVRRLSFVDFAELFRSTFPAEFSDIFGQSPERVAWELHTLDAARDAGAHPGKPYLAAEAQLASAVAHECCRAIPAMWHDPPDLALWFRGLAFGENEGFRAPMYDCASEEALLDGADWGDIHRLVGAFRGSQMGGDMGFTVAVDSMLAGKGLDLFMRAGELTLGTGLPAMSGLFHEHDLGVRGKSEVVLFELKNYPRSRVNKNELMLFHQKTLDFYLALVQLGSAARMIRTFVTTDRRITDSLRGFCLQWGIVLVEPALRPIPALLAVMRDLDGTSHVSGIAEFESHLNRAERLGRCVRPLDRILVPSTLSRWRLLLDAASLPQGQELARLVDDHRRLDAFVRSLASAL